MEESTAEMALGACSPVEKRPINLEVLGLYNSSGKLCYLISAVQMIFANSSSLLQPPPTTLLSSSLWKVTSSGRLTSNAGVSGVSGNLSLGMGSATMSDSDAVDIGSRLSASGSVSSTLYHGQIQIETQPWRYVELAATQVNLYGGPQTCCMETGVAFL